MLGKIGFQQNWTILRATPLQKKKQKKHTHTHTQTQLWFFGVAKPTTNAATGARSKVARVRAEYPNQLDYIGFWGALSEEMLPEFVSDRRAIF